MSDLSALESIPDPLEAERGGAPARRAPPPPANAAPTRGVTERRRLVAIVASLAWLGAHLAVYGARRDLHQLPAAYVAAQVGLPVVFGAACLLVALAPGRLGLGVGATTVAAMALLGPISFCALAGGMPLPHPPGPSGVSFGLGALLCLDITLSWAAAPLLFVALSLRRAFPTQAVARSALASAALGLISGGAINLHCPSVDPWHLLAGHAVPVAVAAVLGALVVVKWARA